MDTLQKSEHTETQKIDDSTSSTKGQTQSPFGRTGIIKRTPPRSRTCSLPDFKEPETDHQNDIQTTPGAVKRKRSGSTPEKRTWMLKIASNTFEATIREINTLALQLEKVINETYRPKMELCEISRSLLLQVERLHSEEVKKFIEVTTTQECLKAQNEKIKKENEELRMKLRSMRDERNRDCVEKMEMPEDKCVQCRAAQKMGQRRRILKKEETFESFSMVSEEDWASEVFSKATTEQGSVWESSTDWDIILPCSRNFASESRAVNRAIITFGGKEGLIKQNLKGGDVATMQQSVGFPHSEGTFKTSTRSIYYPVHGDQTPSAEDGKTLFQSLKTTKKIIRSHGRRKVGVPEIESAFGAMTVRMLEYLFSDAEVQISIFQSQREIGNHNPAKENKSGGKKSHEQSKRKRHTRDRKA